MNSEELYKEFLKNFPSYEPMVLHHIRLDDHSIKIITKQNKAFIFRTNNGEIQLETVK